MPGRYDGLSVTPVAQEAEIGESQSKLASKNSQIGKLLVQVRYPASVCKVEKVVESTHTEMGAHIREHEHTHAHTIHI